MTKSKKVRILSWVLTLALIFSNFIGMGPVQLVKAAAGTNNDPLTVAEAIANNTGTGKYVTGYIIGTTPSGASSYSLVTSSPFSNTNLILADSPTENDKTKAIPVQLPNTAVRSGLNLVDHPENLGKKVILKGDLTAYFSFPGLKNVIEFQFVDNTPSAPVAVTGVTLNNNILSLGVDQTSQLTATISPDNATNKNVTWSTDNPSVVTVTNGLVKGVSAGTATITVTTEDQAKTSLCVVTVTANAPPANKTFDLVGITDFHGQLLNSTNTLHVGAALTKVVKDIKTSNPNRTLIIGGGDLYQGTPVSNVLHGVPVQQAFSNMGMEVTALGNHEFDWGLDVINNQTMIGASYEIVSANLYNKTTQQRVYKPYKVFEKDGVKIAVIGAITEESPTIILPANVANFEFRDVATEVNTVAKQIRDSNEADIVLASIHEGGSELPKIVSELKGIDAVFGGHSHTILNKLYPDSEGKNIPTVIANSSGKGYIDLKMTVTADKNITFDNVTSSYVGLTVSSTTPLDPEVKDIVDKAYADLAPIFNVKIGTNASPLTKDQVDSPYGESQLGNWMADVVKDYAGADVGMVNNGGIRLSPIPAGDITVGTIFNLMPFDNTVCYTTMTGAQLKFIFEQAVQDNGKGIQISGVKFVYDSSKPSYKPAVVAADGTVTTPEVPGQRVLSIVRETDNSVVKDTDILKVAAPDFLATGGDTFTGFLNPEVKATLVDMHVTVRDALNADVTAKGKITVVMNNRVDNQMAVVAPVAMTIAEARTTTKTAVILTGTVSAVNGNNVFMQDETAGICVYNSGGKIFTAKKGDKITVTGNLSVYSGLLEVTPTSAADVVLVSTGNVVTPKEVTVNSTTNALQGQLVKIKNLTIDSIDNAGATMAHDATGSINIYKMPVVAGLAAGDIVDVTAAVTCYGTTIELAVDSANDVVKTGTAPVPTGATISVVATSDMHGNVLNFDYGTNAAPSKAQGLAKVSTYVKGLRATNPNVMLVDNGDTIQGTPLVYYYNMIDKTATYPMAAVMGAMKYDGWTLGNHEFNYGLETLNRIIADAKNQGIDVLSANTYKTDNTNFVEPYTMKSFNVNGKIITVAVLGLTTKTIPSWEDPAHYAGLHFNDLVDEAKKWVPIVKAAGADVVVVTAHTGEEGAADVIPENQAKALATQVIGIDAIVAGHAHSTINDLNLKNPEGKVVPIIEPGKWGNNVAQIDIAVDENGAVTGLTTKNVAMTNTIAEDPAIVSLIAPYQAKTLEYTSTVLGQSTGEYKGNKQITEPTEIMELINKVQAGAAGTQLSIAAPLSLSAYIPSGNITIKDIMGVYVYENFLYGVKMTGKQIKDWMEYTVRYYKQVSNASDPIVKDPALNIADYNLDQLYGASYDIDLTQPACTLDSNGRVASGNRIKNLKFNGNLVKDSDIFTVAINNYRYNGGGGFMAAAGISNTDLSLVTYDSAKALGDDGQVRSLMMKYVQDNKTITPSSTNNWKISTSPVAQQQPTTISVVATSDMHGNVLNFDYGTNAAPSKAQGLAKVSTYVNGLRAANPNVMLVDNGDTIQGTPLVYYYNMLDKTTTYPMAAVMGAMKYDSWTLGNHEFNYGLETLNRIMTDAKTQGIDVLSANTYKADNTNFVEPYTMKSFNINGKIITVAILGLTTKTIPSWEDPAHYAGLHFNDLVDEAKKWVPIVKAAGADVVIVTAHTGEEGAADVIPENQAKALATQVSGIDAIVAGHAHSTLNDLSLKNPEGKVVPVIEPGKWGNNIAQIDIAVDENGAVTGLTTKNVAMTNTIAEDPAIVSLIAPYQAKTLEYTSTVLGQSTGEYKGDKQITEPTAIMELINKVQAGAAGTQLSIAAPLSLSAYIPKGDITIKDIMGVYVYENFLYGVKMNGKQIKDWMEYTVRYYKQVSNSTDPIVKDPALNIADYNLDQLYGASYDIDLTQPACTLNSNGSVASGNRIKNLKVNGKLVKDSDVFTVAINNYRYNGGGGFMAAAGISNTDPSIVTYDSAKALGDDGQVRSLMMKYVQDNKTITPSSTNNWVASTAPVVQEVEATGVELNKASLNLVVGKNETLVATVLPENATNKAVVWSSSDEKVATVKDGVVTAVAGGNATITVKTIDGGFTASCAVTSVVPVTGISLNKPYLTIKPGEVAYLIATVTPSNASNKKVIWKSSNPSVATVDENGKITGKTIGSVVITATTEEGNYSASAYAAVAKVPVSSVALNRKSVIITKNDTVKLIANINPGDASVKDMVWSINSDELGNLAVDGKTAILKDLKPGTIKVTVTTLDGGYTNECTVIVVSSASEISKVLKLQHMLNSEF